MKSINVARILTALALVFAIGNLLSAQDTTVASKPKHRRYKLIDLGTLGGANSQVNGTPPPMINNEGVIAGSAERAESCSYFDMVVLPAFGWKNGVLTDFGLLPGGCFVVPAALNSQGVFTGPGDIGIIDPVAGVPEIRAVLGYRGRIFDLGTFGGTNSLADDLNGRVQVAGGAENTHPDPLNFGGLVLGLPSPTAWHAFLWQDGRMRDLGTLGGPDSFGEVINERGQVTGISLTNSTPNPTTDFPTADPFLWDHSKMTDLGTLGGTFGFGNAVNNPGQVAGFSDLEGDLVSHAFFWERGVLTDIGTLGGNNSNALWLNDAGEVVGNADLADGTHHGFVWSKGKMTDIGTLSGDPCSNGFHINAHGQVIGTSTDCRGTILHFFLWENGSMSDLGAQVLPGSDFAFIEPVVINDEGEIVGNGTLLNGNVHAVLLKPDGDCDGDCEARAGAGQNNVRVAHQNPSNTATREKPSSTTLERLRKQMRQSYRLPSQR
jgi:probable HAF family extracellular repeat protein